MDESLIRNRAGSPRPFLVFSSVGDYSKADTWFAGRRNYDVWLTQYSDGSGVSKTSPEYFNRRKGSKWQNLKFAMDTWPEIFDQYLAVWVTDDDIALPPRQINRLFRFHTKLGLWVSQPAFNRLGRVSLKVTEEDALCRLRYTNYVEVTCPMVEINILKEFNKVYDPRLVGYGIDWCLMHHINEGIDDKVAIFDCIRCTNPKESTKGGIREIRRLQSDEQRRAMFETVKREQNITIDRQGARNLRKVREKNPFVVGFRVFRQLFWDKATRKLRWQYKQYIDRYFHPHA
ncbi:MAG: hypothetical protein R3280_07750 [Marinobacter sp.]|uniref:hypothetical protein n=1 Tax=Marinobacter sp. TaxID=50741 RepID=UPI00299DFE9E|nr:hypothetical protein [Marinobacter sp.]MDX1634512.1 hypothetical protein [Marinobacter sp.]